MENDEYTVQVDLVHPAARMRSILPRLGSLLRDAPSTANPWKYATAGIVEALEALGQVCADVKLDGAGDRIRAYKGRVMDWNDDKFRSDALPSAAASLNRTYVSLAVAHSSAASFLNATLEVIDAIASVLDQIGHGGGNFLRQWKKYLQSRGVAIWREAVRQVEARGVLTHDDVRHLQELSRGR